MLNLSLGSGSHSPGAPYTSVSPAPYGLLGVAAAGAGAGAAGGSLSPAPGQPLLLGVQQQSGATKPGRLPPQMQMPTNPYNKTDAGRAASPRPESGRRPPSPGRSGVHFSSPARAATHSRWHRTCLRAAGLRRAVLVFRVRFRFGVSARVRAQQKMSSSPQLAELRRARGRQAPIQQITSLRTTSGPLAQRHFPGSPRPSRNRTTTRSADEGPSAASPRARWRSTRSGRRKRKRKEQQKQSPPHPRPASPARARCAAKREASRQQVISRALAEAHGKGKPPSSSSKSGKPSSGKKQEEEEDDDPTAFYKNDMWYKIDMEVQRMQNQIEKDYASYRRAATRAKWAALFGTSRSRRSRFCGAAEDEG